MSPPPAGIVVPIGRTSLRQLLIGAASYVLDTIDAGGRFAVRGAWSGPGVVVRVEGSGFSSRSSTRTPAERERWQVIEHVLGTVGGSCQIVADDRLLRLTLHLPGLRRSPRSLLVIDDNQDVTHLIRRFAASHGYVVSGATSVAQGVALARSSCPDVIMLDVMLPEEDGWDALQALKHYPTTEAIPILVCSVLPESALALSLGATEFMRKPLSQPALLAALDRCVGSLRRPAEASRVSPAQHERGR
jgi:CheY-like chemotaxis protein